MHGLPGPDLPAMSLPAGISRAAGAVLPAIAAAAGRTGVNFSALFHTARLESGFNPSARANSSTATGLFQFIDSTWLEMLERHGAANGIASLPRPQALALRNDPEIASLMAAEHMAENATALEKALGRRTDATDLYLAHFLGAGGATRFLRRLADAPETAGATLLPAAAKANQAIFYAQGVPRSLAEIHRLLGTRLAGSTAPGPALPAAIRARAAAGQPDGPGQNSSATAVRGMETGVASGGSTGNPIPPAEAARFAYLLLAELGG